MHCSRRRSEMRRRRFGFYAFFVISLLLPRVFSTPSLRSLDVTACSPRLSLPSSIRIRVEERRSWGLCQGTRIDTREKRRGAEKKKKKLDIGGQVLDFFLPLNPYLLLLLLRFPPKTNHRKPDSNSLNINTMTSLAVAIPRPLDRLLAEEREKAAEVAAGIYGASPTGATTPGGGARPGGAPQTDALRRMKKMPLSSSVAAVVEVPPGR